MIDPFWANGKTPTELTAELKRLAGSLLRGDKPPDDDGSVGGTIDFSSLPP